jgi:hypothetical protein
VQITVGAYSILLTLGDVAFQIVLLYISNYIKWLLFMIISIGTVTLIVSVTMYFLSTTFQTNGGLDFILYNVYLNGPTLIFMWPFLFYLQDIDLYISTKYPDLYRKAVNTNFTAYREYV